MTALELDTVQTTLARLHGGSRMDWSTLLRALPDNVARLCPVRSAIDALKPARTDVALAAAQGRALYQLARANWAQRIVEFGAGYGLSTIYLAAAVRDNGGGEVITTEIDFEKIAQARANFDESGLSDLIDFRPGNGLDTLADAPWPVCMIVLNGAEALRLPVLKMLEEKLRPNAVVLCADTHRAPRTLKPYLDHVRASDGAYTSMPLPFEEGLEFSVFRGPGKAG